MAQPQIREFTIDELRRALSSGATPVDVPGIGASARQGLDLASTLQSRELENQQRAQAIKSEIDKLKAEQIQKQREQDFAKNPSIQTGTPAFPKEAFQNLLDINKVKETPVKTPRPFALQPKGRLKSGETVSFDPGTGLNVLPSGKIYDPSKQGELQPIVEPTLSNEMIKDVANIRNSISQLKQVESLFDKNAVGPIQARLQDFSISTGIDIPALREIAGITDQKTRFRATIQSSINDYIKAITGAQMSEPEARRIMKALPRRDAADEAFIPALQQIIELSRNKLKNNLDVYKAAGFRNIDDIAGLDKEQTANTPQSQIQLPSADEIAVELKRRGK